MQRDFKVGLVVGVCALLGVLIWLASRESFSPEARLEQHFQQTRSNPRAQAPKEPMVSPNSMPTVAKQEETETKRVSTPDPGLRSSDETDGLGPVDLATQPTRPKIKTQPFHIVQRGETLSQIAQEHYGSVRYVKVIVAANQDLIKDADLIKPGMRLILPDINESP